MMPPPPVPPLPPARPAPTESPADRASRTAAAPPRRLWLSGQPGSDASGPDSAQFDALTDLFLGEVSRPRRAPSEPGSPGRAGDGPTLRLTGFDDGDTDDPGELDARSTGASPAPAVPAPRPRTGPAFIECLIVGNLPVLASAWASQYVREIAEIGGRPVASLRLQGGYATIDLIGAEPPSPAVPAAGAPASLEAALRRAADLTDRWVIRVDPADEPSLVGRRSVRLVTLLTGADESARVGAYSMLKQIAERLPDPPTPPTPPAPPATSAPPSGPMLRVAIMSAPGPEASAAAARLVETARTQLNRAIQHAICSARIKAATPPVMLFGGRTELNAPAIIDLLERIVERPGAAATTEEAATPAPPVEPPTLRAAAPARAPSPEVSAVIADLDTATANDPDPGISALPARTPDRPLSPPTAESAAVPRIDDVRLWASAGGEPSALAPEPGAPADNPGPLAAHIAALRPAALVCPYAGGVEFGLDDRHGLHLMIRDTDVGNQAEGGNGGLGKLMTAAAWAEAHRPLIAAALGTAIGPARPMLHLFTAKPRQARGLLDTDVRFHILAPVTVGGKVGWYCAELN
ncbi:MAG: hypothetical protein IT438_15710 [Phycisphaerales bacterium]|nr:hypothetical protein [Phycisphaerales bacterium]